MGTRRLLQVQQKNTDANHFDGLQLQGHYQPGQHSQSGGTLASTTYCILHYIVDVWNNKHQTHHRRLVRYFAMKRCDHTVFHIVTSSVILIPQFFI